MKYKLKQNLIKYVKILKKIVVLKIFNYNYINYGRINIRSKYKSNIKIILL